MQTYRAYATYDKIGVKRGVNWLTASNDHVDRRRTKEPRTNAGLKKKKNENSV